MIENKKSEIFQKKYLTHVKNPTDIGTTPQHPRQEVPLFIATSNNYTTLNNKNKRIHSLYPELLKRRLKKKKEKIISGKIWLLLRKLTRFSQRKLSDKIFIFSDRKSG